uniref:Endoplasmic reticulum junction formation protein lunapark n=1 Tax=Scophthalmus maximus TaxID=52904 RepID=A0A8D2ZK89_SCOMX
MFLKLWFIYLTRVCLCVCLQLWVGRLLFYSSVFYLLICLFVYCLFLPEQWWQKLLMALPFFLYPVLVWFIRKLLIFLFSKRTDRNNDKLEDSKAAKKKILEEVMETETYKNAKLILERFDPEAKKKTELESTPVRPQMTPRPGQEIRQRGMAMRPMPMGTPVAMAMTPPPGARPLLGPGGTPVAPGGPPERSALSPSVLHGAVPRTPCSPIPGVGMHPPGPPLARPVLPKDRGAVDRVIEYLVGDGPQNRYALICQQCFSHNGMALKEEFEYLAFRCAYCYFLNPARKTRPQAPRLPEFSYERRLRAESRSPGPPLTRSGTDTEESAPPSGDEKETGEDNGRTEEVASESQSQEQLHEKEEEVVQEEVVVQEEEVVQEEVVVQEEEQEVVEDEEEQSHSAPCETPS